VRPEHLGLLPAAAAATLLLGGSATASQQTEQQCQHHPPGAGRGGGWGCTAAAVVSTLMCTLSCGVCQACRSCLLQHGSMRGECCNCIPADTNQLLLTPLQTPHHTYLCPTNKRI
jgi:hypothetical protein